MKLSNVFAKLTCTKVQALRVLAAATLAGAVFTAAAPAAKAQHVSFGVQIGGPRVYAPAPPPRVFYAPAPAPFYGPGFYDRRRWEERQAFLRHEELERARFYHHDDHGYGRDNRGYGGGFHGR